MTRQSKDNRFKKTNNTTLRSYKVYFYKTKKLTHFLMDMIAK